MLFIGAALWLLRDAFRSPHGQLHFAQGQWQVRLDGEPIAGTLRLQLDLQNYMLVSFAPHAPNQAPAHQSATGFFRIKTQWFHLEARHVDPATGPSGWLALRRAVHAGPQPNHEERLA